MELDKYQEQAIKTAIYGAGNKIIYPTLGMAGEAGEVANKVKKVLREKDGVFTDEAKGDLAAEVGDVLWYVALLARDLGYSLEEIAEGNLKKLKSRQERGKLSGDGDKR